MKRDKEFFFTHMKRDKEFSFLIEQLHRGIDKNVTESNFLLYVFSRQQPQRAQGSGHCILSPFYLSPFC